jgi:hypothetical protein
MKAEDLYQELRDLAGKLDVDVSEQNFRNTGIRVKSGLCKVKNKNLCMIDRHLRIHEKIEILAECLSEFPHEGVYVLPAVRELLERVGGKKA